MMIASTTRSEKPQERPTVKPASLISPEELQASVAASATIDAVEVAPAREPTEIGWEKAAARSKTRAATKKASPFT